MIFIFLWGNHSLRELNQKIDNKCENNINNILLNGYSHQSSRNFQINNKEKNELLINFLFLDQISDKNDSYIDQLVDVDYINNVYNMFFKLLLKYSNLHLTIKRKNKYLDSLDDNNQLFKLVKKTKRLNIIKDNIQLPPSNISSNMDYIFALTVEDLPSALLECLHKNNKGIIIDFTNLKNIEKEIYNFGENQIIFHDYKKMFHKLDFFLKNNKFDEKFGNWDKLLNRIKSFDDFEGSTRISEYLYNLITNVNNKNIMESIKESNQLFIKKYGKDKVKNYFMINFRIIPKLEIKNNNLVKGIN